ncbi:unnamed protein product [Chrysodeixis includens]|uniref:Uncharacterized protein n=1 Tax=Chrysodeixis includens TaxID=689277 RepID=A0A9P0FU66_CHRIL|nr:unnamed protein product [Chrysodeixis includens]
MRWNYTSLRWYIKGRKLASLHQLQNCHIVIDGDSYFKEILDKSNGTAAGLDCDTYADILEKNLTTLLENNVTCYIIFNGAAKVDLEKQKESQQRIINNSINNDLETSGHFQPKLLKEIQKQVLDKMRIKYFVCEYECTEAVVGLARQIKCPVLTNRIEYCLLGVSCIPIYSIKLEEKTKAINCLIYGHEAIRTMLGVYKKMPVLLTILHETGDYVAKLGEVMMCGPTDLVPVIKWVKRQREEALIAAITKNLKDDKDKAGFMQLYQKIKTLFLFSPCNLAVKHFQRQRPHELYRDDRKWFAKGVSSGRIAIPYINLKKKGVICGSSLVNDVNQPDALLAAMDIIAYSHCILTNSQDSKITFIGRNDKNSIIKEIRTHFDQKISNRNIFKSRRKRVLQEKENYFEIFLENALPGFELMCNLLTSDIWILMISLVYYIHKKNKHFVNGAYSVLLSYFLLGPLVNLLDLEIHAEDFQKLDGLQFLFESVDKGELDHGVVHSFSEFLHCLQHLNYLNILCGKKYDPTIYHETYNATFVYNTFLFMKDKDHLMTFLESTFQDSIILKHFKMIVKDFETCLAAVKAHEADSSSGASPLKVDSQLCIQFTTSGETKEFFLEVDGQSKNSDSDNITNS